MANQDLDKPHDPVGRRDGYRKSRPCRQSRKSDDGADKVFLNWQQKTGAGHSVVTRHLKRRLATEQSLNVCSECRYQGRGVPVGKDRDPATQPSMHCKIAAESTRSPIVPAGLSPRSNHPAESYLPISGRCVRSKALPIRVGQQEFNPLQLIANI